MCGICGKMDFTGATVSEDLVDRMCRTLVHRGPDAQGIHVGPGIGLGQRRLSIIDLNARGVAPLANEDGSVWVTFNGEIYNFRELRAQLEERGHVFRTATDTEVLVHLYEEYGVDCVQHLRGMFAFALWDAPRRRLFLARDRLGKKPLFYTRTAAALIFGSEARAVLADPSIDPQPDLAAIDAYLSYQYVPSPVTAFAGMSKLPPAHYAVCDARGSLQVIRYWRPPSGPKSTRPAAELRDELMWRLREAVRMRLIADVPIGAFLSGGVDSATVVALMSTESGRRVKTFSIGFEDAEFNELAYARMVAERYDTEHHEFMVRPDAADVLPRLVHYYGEPFADSSALPTYYVSKMARASVTVALSGDGGDETFAGYENYRAVAKWDRYDAVPYPIRRAVAHGATAVLERLPYTDSTSRAARGARMWAGPVPERFRLQTAIFKPQEKQAAYTPEFRATLESRPAAAPVVDLGWDDDMDAVDWMMRHDQHFYLPDCLMVKTDIASMAHGLEVRCPLLDHTLVEFAATIPSQMKHSAGEGKRIFKDTVRDLVPAAVISKHKTGFGVPLARWLREDLSEMVRATLLDDRARQRRLFVPSFVARLIDDHQARRRDWSARIWALLFLELWFREFID
jgi:asparagine synthase (glutamine-hydrolysing)